MKKLLILFTFFAVASYAQINPGKPDFLISGEDNNPSTYIQQDHKLFVFNSDEFITTWMDYRNAEPQIYAQRFDKHGIKKGNNFILEKNAMLAYNKLGTILSIQHHSVYNPILDYYWITANFLNSNNQSIANSTIESGYNPWCGFGSIGSERILLSSDSCFFYFMRSEGSIQVQKYNNKGQLIDLPNDDSIRTATVSGIAANSRGDFFYAWVQGININEPNGQEILDSLPNGIYAAFYKDDEQIKKNLLIKELSPPTQEEYYISNLYFKAITLNDSVYKLFWVDAKIPKLYSIELSSEGNILCEIDSFDIPKSELTGLNTFRWINEIFISNLQPDGFYLSIPLFEYDDSGSHNLTTLISYDKNGDRKNAVSKKFENTYTDGGMFYTHDNYLFKTSSDKKDIYLDKVQDFSLLETQKINDDESGSNEYNSHLVKDDDDKVFATWNDEEKSYGTIIDKDGNITGDKISLKGSDIKFLSNENSISVWINQINDSTHGSGFSIYDNNFNEQLSTPLLTARNPYDLKIQMDVFSDSGFAIIASNKSQVKLIRGNQNGIIDQKEISIFGRMFIGDDNSLWILNGTTISKYSPELELISEMAFPYYVRSYVGEDKFLLISSDWNYSNSTSSYYGIIINSKRDTLVHRIPLGQITSYSGVTFDAHRLIDDQFLIITKNNNKFFARNFSAKGYAVSDSFIINSYSDSFISSPKVIVNNNKVFFTWSDARTTGKGYDIYGSIFDLSSITSVKEISSTTVPTNFSLFQNYPNPFNPLTKIRFSVPEFSFVIIKLYDVLGNEILTLVDEKKPAGVFEVDFNGDHLASGVYYYKLITENFSETRKMILLK